jgi:hypothetical protein
MVPYNKCTGTNCLYALVSTHIFIKYLCKYFPFRFHFILFYCDSFFSWHECVGISFCLYRLFMIFEECLDSNLEFCRSTY